MVETGFVRHSQQDCPGSVLEKSDSDVTSDSDEHFLNYCLLAALLFFE